MKANIKSRIPILILILAAVILGLFYYFIIQKPKTGTVINTRLSEEEEILKSLTAPNEGKPVPQEVLDSLTAPNEGKPVPQEVLDSLTAPAN